jgi:hypothetical protein
MHVCKIKFWCSSELHWGSAQSTESVTLWKRGLTFKSTHRDRDAYTERRHVTRYDAKYGHVPKSGKNTYSTTVSRLNIPKLCHGRIFHNRAELGSGFCGWQNKISMSVSVTLAWWVRLHTASTCIPWGVLPKLHTMTHRSRSRSRRYHVLLQGVLSCMRHSYCFLSCIPWQTGIASACNCFSTGLINNIFCFNI